MTYEDKDAIKELLENDGAYPGDPQMYSIYSYVHTATNKESYAVFSEDSHFDLDISRYVANYQLLWEVGLGLTEAGKQWLTNNK